MADLDHQVGQAVHEGVALVLCYSEVAEHALAPVQDVPAQHVVALVPLYQLLLLRLQQLVLVLLESLVVVVGQLLVLALQREDLVFADGYVLEAVLDVNELPLESVYSLERVVVEFIVLFHPFEDLFGLDDVGVGLDVVVGLVGLLVPFDQQVALHLYDLRKDAMGV